GKAAALRTIAVQEAAKGVASWLRHQDGGVAVVEAGNGWASSRHGREALPAILRAEAGPDVGLLWVELLPSGLSGSARVDGQEGRAESNGSQGGGREGGGFHRRGAGRVAEVFQQTGNLTGAAGNVFYESVRGPCTHHKAGRDLGTGRSPVGCYVSLADEASALFFMEQDVKLQLDKGRGGHHSPFVSRIGEFAACLRVKDSWRGCPVYITRHGESVMNQEGKIGGDSPLSENGQSFALALMNFISAQSDAQRSQLSVWCSPMKRAVQTARAVSCRKYIQWQALRELDSGVFNGYSYTQVRKEI
ncbi:unnamed protein product, partial [Discosporangium mesarthrocarpum]